MSETFIIIFNLIGLTVFGFIGLGVYCLVSTAYWNTGKYGPYDLPWWVDWLIIPSFVLLWGGIMLVLTQTVWEIDYGTCYTISISW